MLPKELKEILHTEFVKYFERKAKTTQKETEKNKLCADYIYKDT